MKNLSFQRILLLAAVVALVGAMFALSGCGGDGDADNSSKVTVKIGIAGPLTGDNAVYGLSMRNAAQMAIDELNESAEAEEAGIAFELRAEDDAGDPKQAVNVANMLTEDADVAAIIGHFNSGCTIPASAVYNDANVAMVTVSTTPTITEQGFAVTNRITARDDSQGKKAAEIVWGDGIKTVAVVDDSTAYGQGLAGEFVAAYKALGGEVVSEDKVQPKEVNFSSLITKITSAKPGAIYYAGAHTEGALIRKQSHQSGLTVPLYGGEMLFTSEFMSLAGDAEGDVCTVLGLPIESQPGGPAFAESFTAQFGKAPEAYDTYAYDSALIIGQAILEVGSGDRAEVAEAIRNISYDGITGVVEFDENGDNKQQVISVYTVKGGSWAIR